jgi:GH24 family phage-related lysozyme (muramidase)
MNTQKAKDLIKLFEGLRLRAYRDPVGVATIGYGHTQGVRMGDEITEKQANFLLDLDMKPIIKKLESYDSKYHWNENEFNALLSFGFNLGIGSIDQVTANGTRTKGEIASKMLLYYNAGGKRLEGLVRRRQKEHDLFIKPVTSNNITEQTTISELVDLVYSGFFGNGEDRKNNIYKLIQSFVNERGMRK